ncbi:glycosyltransferase [Romboutsia maritimum]|uniref:Glycosyltransferase n=1 Tax=Romboutsia maritimum TaxID=2020948 RepID=A0A371IVK9_9FIRM|nr:glycosyltransferase [Romboutsia maritimum]RDY24508.1 glycosyltransferase [Romboutsia maritimum]
MLLSIVMMVRNEEKHLDNTLKSLKKLREQVDSELIILDTGSTDNTVEIAAKYTDKIYFKQWNKNFSDMRNVSISYAKGDWIFILDADEELVDCKKMVEFFKTDLCKKYNSAYITLKNIYLEDKTIYDKVSLIRLFKNDNDFKYKGAIHEQPDYKNPVYKNIAIFDHYGYMFLNEELKQKKLKRNEEILFSELKLNPMDPYVHYQLGKNYIAYGKYEEAMQYMEKSYELYKNLGYLPITIRVNLAKLCIRLFKFEKCEKICLKYIKKDDKNIDIYYYLALSQSKLGKNKESLKNYEKYKYLLNNYDISTQANDVTCEGETVSFINEVEIAIISIYYDLEMYKKVFDTIKTMDLKEIKRIYLIIFMSLYKLNKLDEILNLYNNLSNSEVEKNEFKINLEKLLLSVKESDKEKLYEILSKIDGNYGMLNSIRLGNEISTNKYNEVLIKENALYYGDLLYIALNKGIDLLDVLEGVNYSCVRDYLNYIVSNRRDCILDLYDYLLNSKNTLDKNKLIVYSCLSRTLLFGGNLIEEKYKNIFLMYITYQYDYIREIYNSNLSDEILLDFIKDDEDKFIVKINLIQKNKDIDKLEYIKQMKKLLLDYPEYKKGIKILINRFEKEFNENEELKLLKSKYKAMIEENINLGNLNNCLNMIKEYEEIFKDDDIFNIKGIISIYNNNLEEADRMFKYAYLNYRYDENTLFNIGFVKEQIGEFLESNMFYKEVLKVSKDEKMKEEIYIKLKMEETTTC